MKKRWKMSISKHPGHNTRGGCGYFKETQKQAAEIFGLHIWSVNRIWLRYKEGGKRNIKMRMREVRQG